MIPIEKVKYLISKHKMIEQELSSGNLDKKIFADKSKEYSELNEIIKLPIDLACISEKLLNRLALLIPPKVLATTKDKRDKILNKLYKRRVEIDFSRKAGSKNGIRSIASYLTCCQHCGFVYLEHFDDTLVCKDAEAYVDFRGNLRYRHMSIASWSLSELITLIISKFGRRPHIRWTPG